MKFGYLVFGLFNVAVLATSMTHATEPAAIPDNDQQVQIIQDYKTTYYWAFYGSNSRDPEAVGDMVSRLSDLSSKIYAISNKDAYQIFKLDILAQKGPQLTMADVVTKRTIQGLQMGLHYEVRELINSAHRVNPQFAASLSIMALGLSGTTLDRHTKDYASPPTLADLDHCMRSCSVYFLGLQRNRHIKDMATNGYIDPRSGLGSDFQQIYSRFPNEKNPDQPKFRTGINPQVAMSNECFATCFKESVLVGMEFGVYTGTATAPFISLPYAAAVGVALGTLAGASKGLQCSTSSACSKDNYQIQKEKETARLKADNDLKEQKNRQMELDQQAKELKQKEKKREEQKEKEKQIAIQEEKRRDEEAKEAKQRDLEKRIKDSFDRTKNENQTTDSSASCDATKTCSGTATARTMPHSYKEPTRSGTLADGSGTILTRLDLVSTPTRYDDVDGSKNNPNKQEGGTSTRMDLISTPSTTERDIPNPQQRDENGNLISRLDIISTPITNREVAPLPKKKDIGITIKTRN